MFYCGIWEKGNNSIVISDNWIIRDEMTCLAIIPARSGSKGLADKNIKLCNGKPLMAHSIEAAYNSGIFDCVHVSTDSELYAEIARDYKADVPFMRSKKLSSDMASSWDMVLEVINNYERLGQKYDMVTLLQPTSPLRTEHDICEAYKEYMSLDAKAVVSVCEMEHSPLWCNTLGEDMSLDGFIPENAQGMRQQHSKYYRINGAIYMVNCMFLRENQNIYRKGCYAYIMEPRKSIDIDTMYEFELAEYFLMKGKW